MQDNIYHTENCGKNSWKVAEKRNSRHIICNVHQMCHIICNITAYSPNNFQSCITGCKQNRCYQFAGCPQVIFNSNVFIQSHNIMNKWEKLNQTDDTKFQSPSFMESSPPNLTFGRLGWSFGKYTALGFNPTMATQTQR